MGIYDREYYRREGPSFLGAITSTGQVCKWLILVNVVVFIVQMLTRQTVVVQAPWGELWHKTMPGWFTDAFLLDTQAVLHGEVWRLLTYAFLHSNVGDGGSGYIFHIVFNMLFLWWFGTDVEEIYGKWEFLTFYLVSAFVGGVAFLAWGAASPDPTRCLGASGAVTAVMVLYALHFPRRLIYIFVLPVPIWLFVVFQVAQDSFIFVTNTKSTTAVTVHLGGALFAFAYYKMHLRLLRLLPDLRAWQRQRRQPRLRVYREEEAPAPVSVSVAQPAPEMDEHLEAKVDALLEKMARYGKESLTDSERALLLRASELYRRRRT